MLVVEYVGAMKKRKIPKTFRCEECEKRYRIEQAAAEFIHFHGFLCLHCYNDPHRMRHYGGNSKAMGLAR